MAAVSGGSWVWEARAWVRSVCSKCFGACRLESSVLSTQTSLCLKEVDVDGKWHPIQWSVLIPWEDSWCSVLFTFEKGEWTLAEGSYDTLTVSASGVSAESPLNLWPYLLRNKFPREINSQVRWSVEAKKKLEASRLTNILQLITHKPWENTVLNAETAWFYRNSALFKPHVTLEIVMCCPRNLCHVPLQEQKSILHLTPFDN